MVSSTRLIQAISEATGVKGATISLHFRNLREAGLIVQQGRGINAASMNSEFAAKLLIAILASRSTQNSGDIVAKYGSLRLLREENSFSSIKTFINFPKENFLSDLRELIDSMVTDEFENFVSQEAGISVKLDDLDNANIELEISASHPKAQAQISLKVFVAAGEDYQEIGHFLYLYGRKYEPESGKNLRFVPALDHDELNADFGEKRHIGVKTLTSVAMLLRQ